MARISGVNLPSQKRVEYGLTYVYGIGLKSSQDILKKAKINFDTRVRDLTDQDVAVIQKAVNEYCLTEGDLRKEVVMNIKRLQEINSYRGLRHKKGLPCRGQRTKTNARTKKGPKKAGSAVALKRKISKK
ncbi:MAG: 30S ribosomal protein S13 [Candidatus Chromulinivorax sp.]